MVCAHLQAQHAAPRSGSPLVLAGDNSGLAAGRTGPTMTRAGLAGRLEAGDNARVDKAGNSRDSLAPDIQDRDRDKNQEQEDNGGSPPDSPSPAPRSTRPHVFPNSPQGLAPRASASSQTHTAVTPAPGSLPPTSGSPVPVPALTLALALGCLGTIAPLIHLAKAAPTPPPGLVALSTAIALGGFLCFFYRAVRRGARAAAVLCGRAGAYTDAVACGGAVVVCAATGGAAGVCLGAVVASVVLGGCLVFWRHGLGRREGGKGEKGVQTDGLGGGGVGGGAMEVDEDVEAEADVEEDTIAEICPVDEGKDKPRQDGVEDIFEQTNFEKDSVVSSTPRKLKLNPFAPEFRPVGRVPSGGIRTGMGIGNVIPDPSVRFPKAIPIMPPRRRVRRVRVSALGTGED